MTALLFLVFQAFAEGCPDFRGLYVNKERGIELDIDQKDCARLEISRRQFPRAGAPNENQTYIPDGKRHPVGAYYFDMRWEGDKLVLEPYGTPEGGEMVGLRTTWSLEANGLLEAFFNPDGSEYERVTYDRR